MSNRGHTNKTWKHASKIKAAKGAYRQDERKCAYCPGKPITLYNNTTAVEEEPQDEWYDGDYDAMVRVECDYRMRTDNGASQRLHKQKSEVFTYVSPPCKTSTARENVEAAERMQRLTIDRQERMQRLQVQEMVVQDLVDKRLIELQQQAPRNSTMQVICSVLATAVGIMMMIIMVLLVKHEEGYSGPRLKGRGRGSGSSDEDVEKHHEHDGKRTSMQQRRAKWAQELKNDDIVVRHKAGAYTCTPNWLSRTWRQWCLWWEHQGYSGPRLTGEGRNGGCGGSTDEDADEDDEDHDDMRYAIRVSMSDTPRRPPPANTTATQPSTVNNTRCPVCGAKFKPSKNARSDCKERSAKSNMEKQALKKGDEDHKALAEALRAEDDHLDNWQGGRVPPGETRNASNWQRHTDQEWRTYIGHYNRHNYAHASGRPTEGIKQPTFW